MFGMAKHKTARILVRARIAAWIVFVSMAGTTMTFQVYHSITHGHMNKGLAVLYGVVPLLISICVLEIVSEWEAPQWAPLAAYAITGGAMFLSAAATGTVVVRAAPPHASWVFGLLMDGAALFAVHFILNGPRKAAQKAAQLTTQEEARRAAENERKEAALRAENDDRVSLRAQVDALRNELSDAQAARTEADAARAATDARCAQVAADLEAARERAKTARKRRAGTGRTARGTRVPNDVGARAEALRIVGERPDISGAQLGVECGMSKRWGQDRKNEYAGHVPGADSKE